MRRRLRGETTCARSAIGTVSEARRLVIETVTRPFFGGYIPPAIVGGWPTPNATRRTEMDDLGDHNTLHRFGMSNRTRIERPQRSRSVASALAVAFAMITFACGHAAEAGTREQAKRLFDRLTGTAPTPDQLDAFAAQLDSGSSLESVAYRISRRRGRTEIRPRLPRSTTTPRP
jgi:hypothetical protein